MKKLTKESPITFVELPATQFGELDSSGAYDLYSKFRLPPRALPNITAVLKKDGWRNIKMIDPLFHGENGKLSRENYQRIYNSDVLGISSITRTTKQSMELADRYKSANPEGIVIAGGMGPSYMIREWLEHEKHADIIVRGEGETTIKELMNRLTEDSYSLEDIKGIAYKNKEGIRNPLRELMTEKEFGELPLPDYDEAMTKNTRTAVVEQERGCPYNCNFCLVTKTYGNTIRYSSDKKIISELDFIEKNKMGDVIFFNGDNLAGNPKRALQFINSIKESSVCYKTQKFAQVSALLAKKPELMNAMKEINLNSLCVGFESLNSDSLKDLNKPFSAEQNTEAARTFRDYGFWIHAMMMAGIDSDTEETIKYTLEWAKENADSLQLFIPTPFPGTPFYSKMEKEGRILTKDWSLYDGQHCVIKPAKISPYDLQIKVLESYRDFYSIKSTLKRYKRSPQKKLTIGFAVYASLGGLNNLLNSPQTRRHVDFLKTIC